MSSGLTQFTIILFLIIINGVFALSEVSLISARKGRLKQKADDGDRSAQVVLELQKKPNTFLSTVQIGISLIGILSGALGSGILAESFASVLVHWGMKSAVADQVAFFFVVLLITYLSLVIGELVPKRLGMNNPEGIAKSVARPILFLSKLASPVNAFLGWSTELGLRILGIRESTGPDISEEEIRMMLVEGTAAGVFETAEHEMVEGVFRLSDRRIDMIVTPRTELEWLNLELSLETWDQIIYNTNFNHLPVVEGGLDKVVGIIRTRDYLKKRLSGEVFHPRDLLLPAVFIPESSPALTALEMIKKTQSNMGMIIDEYGGLLGIITLNDLMEAIIGSIATIGLDDEDRVIKRADGSWLVDGLLPVDELKELLGVNKLVDESDYGYQTMGGFIMAQLGTIPRSGQQINFMGFSFEIVDMDGRRVDKVLVARLKEAEEVNIESSSHDQSTARQGFVDPNGGEGSEG